MKLDPKGNYVHLGDATTDASGSFSIMVTPENSGKYTVYATFAGSKSYYAAYAQTALGVQEKPAEVVVQPETVSIVEQYFVPAVTGIIIAVIVVGEVLAVITIRKRK